MKYVFVYYVQHLILLIFLGPIPEAEAEATHVNPSIPILHLG